MRNKRGFSLVEMAIVMVIVGLLLGGAIVSSFRLAENDKYVLEQRRLERARDAVIAYAFRHRTLPVEVRVGSIPISLPGWRPYLPCPDITGDGLEDRTRFDPWGLKMFWPLGQYDALENFTDEIDVDRSIGANLSPIFNKVLQDAADIINVGQCHSRRGALPHRTLGLPPMDSWGNRYTYEVDEIFSDALVGFNQNSKIDAFDIRRPLVQKSSGLFYNRRNQTFGNESERYIFIHFARLSGRGAVDEFSAQSDARTDLFFKTRNPILICDGDKLAEIARLRRLPGCQSTLVKFNDEGLSVPLAAGTSAASLLNDSALPLPLKAGRIAATNYRVGLRDYRAGDVVEGVPFVILSHGINGKGAFGHEANIQRALAVNASLLVDDRENAGRPNLEDIVMQCNPPADAPIGVNLGIEFFEYHNFPFVLAPTRLNNTRDGDIEGCFPVLAEFTNTFITEGNGSTIQDGFFVDATRRDADAPGGEFDDILIWTTHDELIELLSRSRALPAPDFPFIELPAPPLVFDNSFPRSVDIVAIQGFARISPTSPLAILTLSVDGISGEDIIYTVPSFLPEAISCAVPECLGTLVLIENNVLQLINDFFNRASPGSAYFNNVPDEVSIQICATDRNDSTRTTCTTIIIRNR